MRVLKYTLSVTPGYLELPAGARPLAVGVQGTAVVLWACVPDETPGFERRHCFMVPTGVEFAGEGHEYAGTFIHADGTVWHVFVAEAGK